MNTPACAGRLWAGLLALFLSACGGGGGGDSASGPSPAPVAPPTSGHYAWLLKDEGATDNLKRGLSLLHPQDSATEWVIEPPNAQVTDARLVAGASIDTTNLQSSALEPYALVYIVGGDVRRVPLRADGSAPASRVQRAGTSSACRFLLEAVDHGAPERSRFVLATAGADGLCGSADDGHAELRLDPTLGLVLTTLTAAATPLAVWRDTATLAPQAWLLPTALQPWSGNSVPYRNATEPVTRVVLAGHRAALVESARGLSLLEPAAGATAGVTETAVPGLGGSAGAGWVGIGFDSQSFWAYRNTGSNWSVQRITRANAQGTVMGSGSGEATLASMGDEVLYLSTLDSDGAKLRRLPKAVPGASQLLFSGPATSSALVLTGAAGVHLQWTKHASGNLSVEMVDETGQVIYAAAGGGFSLGPAEASRLDFKRSENRTRFVFVEAYGSRLFGDAALVAYDSASRSALRVGQLPGQAEFGNDQVFAFVLGGPQAPFTGFASRTVNGVVQAAGTRVFSFDPASANSLKITSRQQ